MKNQMIVESYIEPIKKSIGLWSKADEDAKQKLLSSLLNIQATVNEKIFGVKFFSQITYDPNEIELALSNESSFLENLGIWLDFAMETAKMMDEKSTSLDSAFYALMTYINVSTSENLLLDMIKSFQHIPTSEQKNITDFYNNHEFMWGTLDINNDNYNIFTERIEVLKSHEDDFIWLYERLGDNRSKNVLYRTLKHWISFVFDDLKNMLEPSYLSYCDLDLIKETSDDEVFVDCGAYNGDSAFNFVNTYKKYKKIICYEASSTNYSHLQNNLSGYENVVIHRKAVGKEYSTMSINDMDEGSSLLAGGDDIVDVVPIDDDIKEPITLVKMDIEGAEQDAIIGMKNHILNEKPKLQICVYHGNKDIIEVPLLLKSIRDDYQLYLRCNGPDFLNIPLDIVLYAL